MCQANLHTAQERGHTRAVSRQVAEIAGHQGGGGHGSLQHAHEGIAIEGLDDLDLQCTRSWVL